jgi:hypothetical protein
VVRRREMTFRLAGSCAAVACYCCWLWEEVVVFVHGDYSESEEV